MNNASESASLFRAALRNVRQAIASQPVALVALAMSAGLAANPAHAQFYGSGEYERVGRTIGGEVGRAVGSNGSATARVAGSVGELLGGVLSRPMDNAARQVREAQEAALREAREVRDAERRARIQASADAAYTAERKLKDPTYQAPAAGLPQTGATQTYGAVSGNAAAVTDRMQQLLDQFNRQNPQRAR